MITVSESCAPREQLWVLDISDWDGKDNHSLPPISHVRDTFGAYILYCIIYILRYRIPYSGTTSGLRFILIVSNLTLGPRIYGYLCILLQRPAGNI